MNKAELGIVGRKIWTNIRGTRVEILASLRRVALMINLSLTLEEGKVYKTGFVRGKRGEEKREGLSNSGNDCV